MQRFNLMPKQFEIRYFMKFGDKLSELEHLTMSDITSRKYGSHRIRNVLVLIPGWGSEFRPIHSAIQKPLLTSFSVLME